MDRLASHAHQLAAVPARAKSFQHELLPAAMAIHDLQRIKGPEYACVLPPTAPVAREAIDARTAFASAAFPSVSDAEPSVARGA